MNIFYLFFSFLFFFNSTSFLTASISTSSSNSIYPLSHALSKKPFPHSFLIKTVEAASFEIMPDHFLAMDPGDAIQKIDGIPTTEELIEILEKLGKKVEVKKMDYKYVLSNKNSKEVLIIAV